MSPHEPQFFGSPWIDRAAEVRRDPERLATLRRDPNARYLLMRRGRNLVAGNEAPAARTLACEELPTALPEHAEVVFLGLEGSRPWFAVDVSSAADLELPRGCRWVDLRREGPRMSARDAGLLAYARAMLHWHDTHRFCGRCGAPSEVRSGGFLRHCRNDDCRREHFPRTDPAIIVRVTHGDRLLLGRQASWPPRWYSVLAGFVEPGETLEDAVRREVFEEVGVGLHDVRYYGSQPWPFPASLMVGFVARADAPTVDLRDEELDDARWLTREQALRERDSGDVRLPPPTSIAGRLINDWLAAGD